MPIAAQVDPSLMSKLTADQRRERFHALATELYDGWSEVEVAADLRKTTRTVRRWSNGDVEIPNVVLVALGAMLAVKRAEYW